MQPFLMLWKPYKSVSYTHLDVYKRQVWPLREVINSLTRNEKGFFQPSTLPYLRDVYDHTVNFIESLESIRDSLSGMMDIYMASVSPVSYTHLDVYKRQA